MDIWGPRIGFRWRKTAGCEHVRMDAITLRKVMHVYAETPTTSQIEGNWLNLGSTLVFHSLNKPKPRKSTLVNLRMKISSGVDLWGPWIRVSLGKGRRSTETPKKLACGPSICIKVWWNA
jgi:hypothetical protein